jgi:transcriptional regulator GlxA family with amidase domain
MTDRRVAILVYPGFQTLDAVGPLDVLSGLNDYLDAVGGPAPRYAIDTVAIDPGPVTSESGLKVHVDKTLAEVAADLDTLVVAGGRGVEAAAADDRLVSWVDDRIPTTRRVCSVCSGTFVLAATGRLDGHTVTTHWARAEKLAADHPAVTVDAEPIHLHSGRFWTSAGVTAGIDLALALVEEDHGAEAAQTIARWLVMFLRRPGGQSQFAAPVWSGAAEAEPVRQAQDAVHADPGGDHTVEAMARRVGTSARHLTRLFRSETGSTPARYVEQIRIDAARRVLETTTSGVATVARSCGFGTAETMRRAFLRHVGVSPTDYRSRFHTLSPI